MQARTLSYIGIVCTLRNDAQLVCHRTGDALPHTSMGRHGTKIDHHVSMLLAANSRALDVDFETSPL